MQPPFKLSPEQAAHVRRVRRAGLRKIVTEFRAGTLRGRKPNRMCVVVSFTLSGYLRFLGYDCEFVQGFVGAADHAWIALSDGTIIDATASQFPRPNGRQMPRVYIGPLPAWYSAPTPLGKTG